MGVLNGQDVSALLKCLRKKNHGVHAAHLRENGNGFVPAASQVIKRPASLNAPGKANRLDFRMSDQINPDLYSTAVEVGEDPVRHSGILPSLDDGRRDQFSGPGVHGVGFDDHGTACSQRRSGVTTRR